MKKIIFIICSFFLASCSSIKTEEKIIQDFAIQSSLLKNNSRNPTYLISEAESRTKSLEYYEIAYLERKNPDGIRRKIDCSRNTTIEWPIDSTEINTLKNKYKKDTISYYWKKKDFKKLQIPIIKNNELRVKMKSDDFPTGTIAYIFSKPIISLNGKFALLFYSDIGYFRKTDGGDGKTVLLEKVEQKWVIKNSFSKSFD
jgi:hypothetical protein